MKTEKLNIYYNKTLTEEGAIKSSPWTLLPWKKFRAEVLRYQRRIYKFSITTNDEKQNIINRAKVVRLQARLLNSQAAKFLAVRKVTTDNKGRKTPGVDKVVATTPNQKFTLANQLRLDGSASPIRRVWIDKPGKTEKRPLGIPTIRDRAKQALVKLALEPEWEARFEPNSYGFRPARSTHDAIEAVFINLGRGIDKYILDADLKKCFDSIDHEALLTKINTLPEVQTQIRAWLKAGIMEGYKTESNTDDIEENPTGTPQGGILSPLLSNIALHGLENHLKDFAENLDPKDPFPKTRKRQNVGLVRYADDFIITHKNLLILQELKTETGRWLKNIGLEFNEDKTRIINAFEGFDFLGFHIKNNRRNGKTILSITPSKKSQEKYLSKIDTILSKNKSASAFNLIKLLKPVILGYGNYFKYCKKTVIFSKLHNLVFDKLLSWVMRRRGKLNKTEAREKYFPPNGGPYLFYGKSHHDRWTLVGTKRIDITSEQRLFLPSLAWIRSEKHVKIQGTKSIYDGDHVYWALRKPLHSGLSITASILLRKQKQKCTMCKATFNNFDTMEIDHIIEKRDGGREKFDNLQLLHRSCHIEKTNKRNQLDC
jgi:RNA-directed DNA polymerase